MVVIVAVAEIVVVDDAVVEIVAVDIVVVVTVVVVEIVAVDVVVVEIVAVDALVAVDVEEAEAPLPPTCLTHLLAQPAWSEVRWLSVWPASDARLKRDADNQPVACPVRDWRNRAFQRPVLDIEDRSFFTRHLRLS